MSVSDDPKQLREELQREYGVSLPGLSCYPGWERLLRQFLDEAKAAGELDGLKVLQIKEKLGELRIYHNGSRYLQHVSRKLADLSTEVCEACGGEGEFRTDGGLYRTLCQSCEDERLREARNRT
ncbi:hypothetical protein CKO28_14285 [Rhodovibrio sodomensis]|uniref:DksA C4-type domain-containing protein n=1 Tax=Rhodovibrio sodomensis TaxID=1088 RepID=A0ABS1DGZ2_9PROT|nr:hypothetical protein [Rhodovibrio sodomensis]MBK1669202.1 hypothetical protein [Rhodovibrio sodomensis]